jgi:hypothetical protein
VDFGATSGGMSGVSSSPEPVMSYDGSIDLNTLKPGQTYYRVEPCLPGDTRYQQVYCARGGFVTYGVKRSGSAMSRSLGGIGKGFSQLGAAASKTASDYSKSVALSSGDIGELASQVGGGLVKVASVAQKLGKTAASLDVEEALGLWQQAKNWIDDSDELDGVINEDD